MLPSSEAAVINALQMTCDNLTNNNPGLSAYPQLNGTFYQLASNIEILIGTMITTQREELLFGKTQAAKLYELQFRQAHAVPAGVLKSLNPERWNESATMPLLHILEYAKRVRRSTTGTIKYTVDHVTDQATETTPAFTRTAHVTIDIRTKETFIAWMGHAVRVRLPSFDNAKAFVEGPLFHEPIEVALDTAFLGAVVWSPLYSKLVGEEHLTVEEDKYLLMDHYFSSGRVSSEDIEHPVVQLRSLLNDEIFGSRNMGFVDIEWNGYIVQFSTKRDYSRQESLLLTVRVMEPYSPHSMPRMGSGTTVSNWWKNSLLVNDLLRDLDNLIDQLLTRHDQEETEAKTP